jgi:inhibitor of KinA sporulation pathway (predicted exonuclease)
MANQLDRILIIDVEATCWDGANPPGMENDIIEVGVCLLNVQTGELSNSKGILVKPERSTVSSFCTELTTRATASVLARGSVAL